MLSLLINIAFILSWTLQGVLIEYDVRHEYVMPRQWWRILLFVSGSCVCSRLKARVSLVHLKFCFKNIIAERAVGICLQLVSLFFTGWQLFDELSEYIQSKRIFQVMNCLCQVSYEDITCRPTYIIIVRVSFLNWIYTKMPA